MLKGAQGMTNVDRSEQIWDYSIARVKLQNRNGTFELNNSYGTARVKKNIRVSFTKIKPLSKYFYATFFQSSGA